jgi:hypothetical protein
MVRTMKKVRFDERDTVLIVTEIEEVICNSLLESYFNQECHEEEDAIAIENELSNELSHFPVLPTINECHEGEDPAAIHLPVFPTIESTAFSYFPNYSNAISGSSNMYLSRWMMSNNDLNDEPPIQPLRQNKASVNDIIKTALSIVDQSQDTLPPGNEYNAIRARAA